MPPRREKNDTVLKARALRRSMTLPEGMLWRALRQRPGSFKFRRQHPVEPYTVDFYCPAARLVVEVDGQSHSMGDRPQRDEERDRWLREKGYRIMRLSAVDVMNDVGSTVSAITLACRS